MRESPSFSLIQEQGILIGAILKCVGVTTNSNSKIGLSFSSHIVARHICGLLSTPLCYTSCHLYLITSCCQHYLPCFRFPADCFLHSHVDYWCLSCDHPRTAPAMRTRWMTCPCHQLPTRRMCYSLFILPAGESSTSGKTGIGKTCLGGLNALGVAFAHGRGVGRHGVLLLI